MHFVSYWVDRLIFHQIAELSIPQGPGKELQVPRTTVQRPASTVEVSTADVTLDTLWSNKTPCQQQETNHGRAIQPRQPQLSRWPETVRELANLPKQALSTLGIDVIRLQDLPFHLRRGRSVYPSSASAPIRTVRDAVEKAAIVQALQESGRNKARTAGILGTYRTRFYKKTKHHGIAQTPTRRMGQAQMVPTSCTLTGFRTRLP